MRVCLIQQSGGLGDILFTIKIAADYVLQGYRVIWPVQEVYKNIADYIEATNIEFYNIEEEFPHKEEYKNFKTFKFTECIEAGDITYVPLERAFFSKAATQLRKTHEHEQSNMMGKYAMCSMDYSGWASHFSIKRNLERERDLWKELACEEPIHLINKHFGTPPAHACVLHKQIATDPSMSVVNIGLSDKHNIFDWIGVIEKAAKIDTVATAFVFLFEKINLKCIPTIHSRNKNSDSFQGDVQLMRDIYSKEYSYEP